MHQLTLLFVNAAAGLAGLILLYAIAATVAETGLLLRRRIRRAAERIGMKKALRHLNRQASLRHYM